MVTPSLPVLPKTTYLRQLRDEVMCVGHLACLDHFFLGDTFPAILDVLFDGAVEEDWFLAHHADLLSQPTHVQVRDLIAIDKNL